MLRKLVVYFASLDIANKGVVLATFLAATCLIVPKAGAADKLEISNYLIAQSISSDDEGDTVDDDIAPVTDEAAEEPPRQADSQTVSPTNDPALPQIITDLESVPFPVRKMRELILKAAYKGDIEKLRPYIGYGDDVTMLSLGGFDEDPIDFLKSLSGDAEGHEILAIITEILEAPFVKMETGNGEEVYVWPYYFGYPFDKLTPEQRVQLFRIITYGDYEEMVQFGNYLFYRLGITPEGRWRFFVAGD